MFPITGSGAGERTHAVAKIAMVIEGESIQRVRALLAQQGYRVVEIFEADDITVEVMHGRALRPRYTNAEVEWEIQLRRQLAD